MLVAEASIVFVAVNQQGEPVPVPSHGAMFAAVAGAGVIALVDDAGIAYDDVGSGLPSFSCTPSRSTVPCGTAGRRIGRRVSVHPIDMRGLGDSAAARRTRWIATPTTSPVCSTCCRSSERWCAVSRWAGTSRSRSGDATAIAVRGLVLADTRIGNDTIDNVARRRELIEMAESAGQHGGSERADRRFDGKDDARAPPDIYDAVHRMIAQAPTTVSWARSKR
jgi:hypothetical protein